jgi:excisionase family DNA binding protein
MAGKFVSLEEAARLLGLSTDDLVDMRSRGEIRGFRDGTSWKFPDTEIDRVLSDRGVNVLDDGSIAGGSSILVSETPMRSGTLSGSSVLGSGIIAGSDISQGSDVSLVPGKGKGSDVKLVAGKKTPPPSGSDLFLAPESSAASKPGSKPPTKSPPPALLDDSSEDLKVADDDLSSEFRLTKPAGGAVLGGGSVAGTPGSGSDVLSGLEGDLLGTGSGGTGDLLRGDSDPKLKGDDLIVSDDDDDDLVLAPSSDVSVAGDSGINLMAPSDSGLSLESEPLDLAGSSISALDLGSDVAGSGKPGSKKPGSGSLVDFQGEEFQLSPSGIGIETDDESSGSQVIEVEDSNAGMPDMVDFGSGMSDPSGVSIEDPLASDPIGIGAAAAMGTAAATSMMPTASYENPFTGLQVVCLAGLLALMIPCGILIADLARNMYSSAESPAVTTSMTNILVEAVGKNPR